MTCLRQKLTFPGSLIRSYQNQADVHDVGVGGAGDDEIAEGLEVVVGIVAAEEAACVGLAGEGLAIGDGAEDDDAGEAGDIEGGGEGEFPVAAAGNDAGGGRTGRPVAEISRAMAACMRAISRVSPSMVLERMRVR